MWFGNLTPLTANLSCLPDEFVNQKMVARCPERGAKAADRLIPVTWHFLRVVVATGTPPAITASPRLADGHLGDGSLLAAWVFGVSSTSPTRGVSA